MHTVLAMYAWRPPELRSSGKRRAAGALLILAGLFAAGSRLRSSLDPWFVPDLAIVKSSTAGAKQDAAAADRAAQEAAIASAAASEPSPVLDVPGSLAAMSVAEGFRVDAVAAEPLVQTPVSMQFDERGRLWVVQMPSYMRDVNATGEAAAVNQIVVLEDRNDDGLFDTSTVFLDNLVLPRAVAPCAGGAIVLEPPSLYYVEDIDGDLKSDRKTKLLDGFGGIENPEHAGNGLVRGIDNVYHFSQHGLDVSITFAGNVPTITTRRTPAHGQWGVTLDDRGRLYYTPNSTPLLLDVYPKHLSMTNSNFVSPAGIGDNIAQPAAAVYPVRPTPGVNRGYQPGVLRDDRTLASLTAACSPVVNRAEGLGEALRGDVFVCEPAAGVVKRIAMRVETDGVPRGRNAYVKTEFLSSTDERFRPVATAIGPDGCLYIADMHRGVIQHKTYLTEYLKKQIKERELEGPLTYGRIYRIAPSGHQHKPFPQLHSLSDGMLVKLLSHKDGYYRDTAQRLLSERAMRRTGGEYADISNDTLDEIRTMMRSAPDWRTRLHALGTLHGMKVMLDEDLRDAADDEHPAVRTLALEFGSLSAAQELGNDRTHGGDADTRIDAARYVASIRDRALASGDVSEAATFAALQGRLGIDAGDSALILTSVDSAVVREALIAGLPVPKTDADEGLEPAILRFLVSGMSFPQREADYVLIERLADACLRSTPAARLALVECVAVLVNTRGDKAGKALAARMNARVVQHMRLTAAQPRILMLHREPRMWLGTLAGDRKITEGFKKAQSLQTDVHPNESTAPKELAVPPTHVGESIQLPAGFEKAALYFEWPGKAPTPGRGSTIVRPLTVAERDLFEKGRELYSKCVGCHQSEGQGAPGQAPTLAGAVLLTGNSEHAIKILLQGLEGPYTHGSAEFNGLMPAAPLETDEEIAAVLTFARRSFGNVSEPVRVEQVTRVRAATAQRRTPWKREELK